MFCQNGSSRCAYCPQEHKHTSQACEGRAWAGRVGDTALRDKQDGSCAAGTVLCSSCWALSQRQEGWALWLKHKAQGPQAYMHYLWHPRDAHDTTQPPQPRQSWADPRLRTATGDNPCVLGRLAGSSQHQREGDLVSLTWAVRKKVGLF